MTNNHEDIALALRSPGMSRYTLNRNDASDLLDEWENAQSRIEGLCQEIAFWQERTRTLQATIRALEALVALRGAAPEPPAWTVIA